MRLAGVASRVLLSIVLTSWSAPVLAQSPTQSDFGTVSIRARPADAEILIDGERWVTPPDNDDKAAIVVHLAPGRHTIEVRASGRRTYSAIVEVRRGETTPVNVSLPPLEAAAATAPVAAPGGDVASGNSPVVEVPSTNDGFAIAPDFRVTRLNDRTTQFVGFYGGAVFAGQFLIGAGAYWEAGSSTDMWYAGPVLEWRIFGDRAIGLTAHGLAGYGQANDFTRPIAFGGHGRDVHGGRVFFHDEGFFVGEPELQLTARLTEYMRLHVGAGYRFTSSHTDRDGVSGSVSLQFGR